MAQCTAGGGVHPQRQPRGHSLRHPGRCRWWPRRAEGAKPLRARPRALASWAPRVPAIVAFAVQALVRKPAAAVMTLLHHLLGWRGLVQQTAHTHAPPWRLCHHLSTPLALATGLARPAASHHAACTHATQGWIGPPGEPSSPYAPGRNATTAGAGGGGTTGGPADDPSTGGAWALFMLHIFVRVVIRGRAAEARGFLYFERLAPLDDGPSPSRPTRFPALSLRRAPQPPAEMA